MAAEVIEDCMNQSTKNAFMFRDPDGGVFSTFYGDSSADLDVLTSDIRLSNVLSDIDNVTTFEVNLDADLWEANSRIYSGMFGNYDGGAVYVENATTVANFSHRDTSLSWPDVKTEAKATDRATRQLAIIGSEEYRITTALEVPSTIVGLIPHAGWRLQARFSHFPLFTEFTWMRILSRNVTLIGPNRYRVQYELSPGPAAAPTIACATVLATASTYAPGQHIVACHDHILGPIGETVALSPADPSVIIAIMGFYECSFNPGPFTTVDSPYTKLGTTDINQSSAGWYANTTTGGSYMTSFTGGDVNNQVLVAAAFGTAATSPVQEAEQANSGNTATFGSDLTPGNIIIAACMGLRGQPSPPVGWTTIVADNSQVIADSGHGVGLLIMARCVQEGDDPRVVSVPDSAFVHSAFVSEWQVL